jgi:hypothetical protein
MLLGWLVVVLLVFSASADRGRQVVGYFEDWVDVNWWGNNIPGNCLMGCAMPAPFLQKSAPYSQVNFGFTFLTENPNPAQDCCNATAPCPQWDGEALYMARASATGSKVITPSMDVHSIDNSPGLISISEVCRLARQSPSGPKRCLISFGGWSDWARLGDVATAQKAGKLAAKMVLYAFADGIDLDFEHLTEYNNIDKQEFDAFNALIQTLRQEFNAITQAEWTTTVEARLTDLQTAYNAMPEWQKNQSPYYPTNIKYMQELKTNPMPYFEISWTTRFNAFLNKTSPHNYLAPGSPVPPPFATDNEGLLIWPKSGNAIDSVNIMAYDGGSPVGALKFDFQAILRNFRAYGPPGSKLNMGFEPGNQYAGGVWEGLQVDEDTAKFIRADGFGGAMVWGINPDPRVEPESDKWCPVVAAALNKLVQPEWPFGKAPTFSKCDPNSGWNP